MCDCRENIIYFIYKKRKIIINTNVAYDFALKHKDKIYMINILSLNQLKKYI
jgi:hypothetical protein